MLLNWKAQQLLDKPEVLQFSQGVSPVYHQRYNHEALKIPDPGERFTIRFTGKQSALHFLTHGWSGKIEIEIAGRKEQRDLYSHDEGEITIPINLVDDGPHELVGTVLPIRNMASKGYEAWLIGVDVQEDQEWSPKSQPISHNCSITRGQYGTFLTLNNDTVIGASIVGTGSWAPHDLERMKKYIKRGMTVLDIGANIGHHTVAFSAMVGAKGRVVSFEPQTEIFRVLSANCVINGCQNVSTFQSCVGDKPGTVKLYPVVYEKKTNFGALGVDPASMNGSDTKGERARIDTLDNLLSELEHPLTSCDFIKIDVQSFELFVLKGAAETLKRLKPVLFLEIAPHWMSKFYDYKEVYEFLWALGYKIEHPSDPSVVDGEIKAWSGRQGEEWDIFAIPH